MQTASASVTASKEVKEIRLANLTPSVRQSFFKELKSTCCPQLKDHDVETAMINSLSVSNFSSKDFGDGHVAFRAGLPTGEVLITSRKQLQNYV